MITIQEINRLLGVDGTTVKALDVIDHKSHEVLIKTLTYIVTKLSISTENGNTSPRKSS